jgi:hypothetical protein
MSLLRSHEKSCAHALRPAEISHLFLGFSYTDRPTDSRLLAGEHLR